MKNHIVFDNKQFIEDVINGMHDWVRVIDKDNNIIYANRAMTDVLGTAIEGKKCYLAMGRDMPCKNCICRKSVFDGHIHEKEEVINEQIFSVMSSPIKNAEGEIIAAVEVLRDITNMKQLQRKLYEKNKKLQEDLNIARKLQCSLLPKRLPEDKLSFAYIYKPCEAIGGDFLDIFKIDENNVGIYIADVSGHGVSASMLTVFLRSSINKTILSPAAALEGLYRSFNANGFDQDLYITVFYAVINTRDNTITYSNAGHNVSPIIFSSKRFQLLRTPGIPISSWLENAEYCDKTIELEPGDRIFLYTDGVIEIKNNKNEQFGEERLLNLLLNDASSPSGTLNRIYESATMFAGLSSPAHASDDITMALIEIKQASG